MHTERVTRLFARIPDSYVDKYLSQRKIFPTKVDSETFKQNGGKHWKFYVIYLLPRVIHFEFPFSFEQTGEEFIRTHTTATNFFTFLGKNLMHLRFTKFQGLISFTCISSCKHFLFIVRIPEKFQNDITHLLTSKFSTLLFH
jgi:hypothetical protein